MLYRLDGIVHGTLYNYGLRFSNSWAVPFWSMEHLIYLCLLVPSFFGGFALALDLWKSRAERPAPNGPVENNTTTGRVSSPIQKTVKSNSKGIR